MAKEPMIVHCGDCSHEWTALYLPMEAGKAAKLLKRVFCPQCGAQGKRIFNGPTRKATPEGDPVAWLMSGDTGTSSMTIWAALTGKPFPSANGSPDVPYDPDDFGRCYRLLKVMPSWRSRLGEVADKYPKWRKLVDSWDDIAALYEQELPTGMARKCYDKIQQCIGR